jgi:hypothetical protein
VRVVRVGGGLRAQLSPPGISAPLIAHCHLDLGQLHRRTGEGPEASEHLTTAIAMYREMDMRFWPEQAVPPSA